MRNSNTFIFAIAAIFVGIGAAGSANAETSYQGNAVVRARSEEAVQRSDSTRPAEKSFTTGIYNAGGTPLQNVANFAGPANFCKLYFGS